MPKLPFAFLAIFISSLACTTRTGGQDTPEKINVCQLGQNIDAYNHKLIQVTAFVSHGFEIFSLWDPACTKRADIWVDYGGTLGSGTTYCCPGEPGTHRKSPFKEQGITVPLVQDKHFREFNRMIKRKPQATVHATIIGRFFAGDAEEHTTRGYGHLGCCSLFVVQQVLSVDGQAPK